MNKEIWGINVIGKQGVNAENDFAIGPNDTEDDIVFRIRDTELSGAEVKTLKEIAEGGPVPGGSGAIIEQDLDAIGFIPVANTYYQQKSGEKPEPQLRAFAVGDIIQAGDKIHFDTTKGDELATYLANLDYDTSGDHPSYSLLTAVGELVIQCADYTEMFRQECYMLSVGPYHGSNPPTIVYSTLAIPQYNIVEGFQNLDSNGDLAINFFGKDITISEINDTNPPTWNGVIIGVVSSAPESHYIDGAIYYYDGSDYFIIDGKDKSHVIPGDLETGTYVFTEFNGEVQWIAEQYWTVTFDSDGGYSVRNQIVFDGGLLTRPLNPSKAEVTFTGWSADGGESIFDFDTPITANMTLVAQYE